MENGDSLNPTISAEDVISKLKDDGDFDRLRLKIVRKVKENEELRNSIISVVRQSAALNRPGAENMKPRQLSDAIHSEVREKVMGQISDGIWDIIRSGDNMKTEISETVKSVYCKLSNPQDNGNGQHSSPSETVPAVKGPVNNGPNQINGPKESPEFSHSSNTLDDNESKGTPGYTCNNNPLAETSNDEPKRPPGFADSNVHPNNQEEGLALETHKGEPHRSEDEDLSGPPGYSAPVGDHNQTSDGSDDDPELPPGFGG